MIFNFLHSVDLLTDACSNFRRVLHRGAASRTSSRSRSTSRDSLMVVTALNPVIGYDKAAADREEGAQGEDDAARGGDRLRPPHRRGVRRRGQARGDDRPEVATRPELGQDHACRSATPTRSSPEARRASGSRRRASSPSRGAPRLVDRARPGPPRARPRPRSGPAPWSRRPTSPTPRRVTAAVAELVADAGSVRPARHRGRRVAPRLLRAARGRALPRADGPQLLRDAAPDPAPCSVDARAGRGDDRRRLVRGRAGRRLRLRRVRPVEVRGARPDGRAAGRGRGDAASSWRARSRPTRSRPASRPRT